MGKGRRRFTDEFKREAVRLAGQAGMNVSAVARDLGVNVSVVRRWVHKQQTGHWRVEAGTPLKSAATVEVEQLKRELAKVKMERDILKKALGYFAKDPT